MSILHSIMDERRADVARARTDVPIERLKEEASHRVHHSLSERLALPGRVHIVAEMKRASPSAGILRKVYEPAVTAAAYQRAGAAGISVLTEPRHFLGGEGHLREARREVDLPILRKDFMVDAYQVVEAAAWGADLILLIIAGLPDVELGELYRTALSLGLEVLAEAHTELEVEAALRLDKAIVGVNSRNLKTLKTDLAVAHRLAGMIPPGRLAIAESGIRSRADVGSLQEAGYRGFLIGEVLMAAPDPGAKLSELHGNDEGTVLRRRAP